MKLLCLLSFSAVVVSAADATGAATLDGTGASTDFDAFKATDPELPPYVIVLSPTYAETVAGDTTIRVFFGGNFLRYSASVWQGDLKLGRAVELQALPRPSLYDVPTQDFLFPAQVFPHGPIVVRIVGTKADGTVGDVCYWPLYNAVGKPWHEGLASATVPAPATGMTVAFADDFDHPLSISHSGSGATYCSRKPDDSEFGDAIFADHEGPYDPFSTVDTYLRIHCSQPAGLTDPMGWKRTAVSGCISCAHTDGGGFHTAGGHAAYIEARLLYGAAPGSWPAFWLLSAGNHQGSADSACDEYDLVENHLPKTASYHVGHHQWNYGNVHAVLDPEPKFADIGGGADGCETFHTYGCLIEEKTSSIYLDNVKIWEFPTQQHAWQDGMYFCINNGLRAADMNQGGGFSRYGGTCDLWVDWVRVFQGK